jgi:predicted DNA-binding transcriptional regulator AlpA
MPSSILRTPAAAELLGVSISTLEKWRVSGQGPRFVKIGARLVGYEKADLDTFRDSLPRFSNTSGTTRERRRRAGETKAGEAQPVS